MGYLPVFLNSFHCNFLGGTIVLTMSPIFCFSHIESAVRYSGNRSNGVKSLFVFIFNPPSFIFHPASGLNYAVHGLAKRDADAFIVGPELIAPRAYQLQQVGGTVVCAVGKGMIYFRESITIPSSSASMILYIFFPSYHGNMDTDRCPQALAPAGYVKDILDPVEKPEP